MAELKGDHMTELVQRLVTLFNKTILWGKKTIVKNGSNI